MKYFAYGSNMCTNRLRSRVPSANFHAVATLSGHVLKFHKRSRDGSGKCDALYTACPEDEVIGVIFDIDDSQKASLDRAEGLGHGYRATTVTVMTTTGPLPVQTYVAESSATDGTLSPYTWYKDLVLAGAREHRLPDAYIRAIEAVTATMDPDAERDKRERSYLPETAHARPPVVFGFEKEWQVFVDAHRAFFDRVENLLRALNRVFIRRGVTALPSDRVVFYLGRLAVEDFWEILLLCANGYGIAGLKLLRGMYEKCVTAAYLSLHPEEAEKFLDYHHIQEWKLYKRVVETYKDREIVRRELVEKMESEYKRVAPDFLEPLCQRCGTTRMQISWSRLDTFSMAMKVGEGLEQLYMSCYLIPTLQAHATASALFARLEATGEDGLDFDGGAQRDKVDWAFVSAHSLILHMIGVQIRHFKLDLEEDKQKVFSDFQAIWKRQPTESGEPQH